MLDTDTLSTKKVFKHSTMGFDFWNNLIVTASQSSSQNDIGKSIKQHSIFLLDKENFTIKQEIPVSQWDMSDLHGLQVYRNRLYVVDTFNNRLMIFKMNLRNNKLELEPIMSWKDSLAIEKDSSHLNDVFIYNNEIYVSLFGRFERHREYERKKGKGCILNITKCLSSNSNRKDCFDYKQRNLFDPHSIKIVKGEFYYCESAKSQLKKEGKIIYQSERGYLRGFEYDNQKLFIGQSKSRHLPDSLSQSKLLIIDSKSKNVIKEIEMPCDEIYQIKKY